MRILHDYNLDRFEKLQLQIHGLDARIKTVIKGMPLSKEFEGVNWLMDDFEALVYSIDDEAQDLVGCMIKSQVPKGHEENVIAFFGVTDNPDKAGFRKAVESNGKITLVRTKA